MESLILAVSPFVVNAVSHFYKMIPAFSSLTDGGNKTVIRISVVVFAWLGSMASSWISGQPLDPVSLNTAVETGLLFLAAQGSFFLFKKG